MKTHSYVCKACGKTVMSSGSCAIPGCIQPEVSYIDSCTGCSPPLKKAHILTCPPCSMSVSYCKDLTCLEPDKHPGQQKCLNCLKAELKGEPGVCHCNACGGGT
jgi:hypothetical protein